MIDNKKNDNMDNRLVMNSSERKLYDAIVEYTGAQPLGVRIDEGGICVHFGRQHAMSAYITLCCLRHGLKPISASPIEDCWIDFQFGRYVVMAH